MPGPDAHATNGAFDRTTCAADRGHPALCGGGDLLCCARVVGVVEAAADRAGVPGGGDRRVAGRDRLACGVARIVVAARGQLRRAAVAGDAAGAVRALRAAESE